jgi:hypothetical protein
MRDHRRSFSLLAFVVFLLLTLRADMVDRTLFRCGNFHDSIVEKLHQLAERSRRD